MKIFRVPSVVRHLFEINYIIISNYITIFQFWRKLLALPDSRYIDYRARMWLGEAEHVPHGIFDPKDYPVSYTGEELQFENQERIAPLLLQLECADNQL